MKVYIQPDSLFYPEISHVFSVFAFNKGIVYSVVEERNDANLTIAADEHCDIRVSREFYVKIHNGETHHTKHFHNESQVINVEGFDDYLSTAFYILNTVQETGETSEDEFGRFRYVDSFQYRYNSITDNLVQKLFDRLYAQTKKFGAAKPAVHRSRVFLSHDIDTIYGSLLQDGYFALKKARPDWMFKVFVMNVFVKPSWLNMDRIMKIESEYDFYSTFYWLVNKGRVNDRLSNSDYDISNRLVKSQIEKIDSSKWENGIHKSASEESFRNEIQKTGVAVKGNRFHYLKFKPHMDFKRIQEAGLLFDSSVGFAEHYGFRSGYGLPYIPFNLQERKPFSFIECPLHMMDTTFFNYLRLSSEDFVKQAILFFEKHREDCVLSVLFHNNYISDFKYGNYFKAFKTLLSYFYENDFKCITQSEIITKYHYEYPGKINE